MFRGQDSESRSDVWRKTNTDGMEDGEEARLMSVVTSLSCVVIRRKSKWDLLNVAKNHSWMMMMMMIRTPRYLR